MFCLPSCRDHVSWHFMDELRQLALSLDDPRACPQCPYTSDKVDNLVKHLALGEYSSSLLTKLDATIT